MKKLATLVAAIALFAASSVASAAGNMWFSYISSSPNVVIAAGANNAPGQQLHLEKTDLNPGTVRIGINISNDGPLAGWSLSLLSSLGSSMANGAASGAGYDQVLPGGPNGTNAWTTGRGSGSAAGATGLIYAFDLNLGAGPVLPATITGDFGALGVVNADATYWYGFVGNNPISYGFPGYVGGPDNTVGWGDSPVVLVTPEPTTLVLLGLGAVALLRRRK